MSQKVAAEYRFMVLVLWMATGRQSPEFYTFAAEHGYSLTWALLLSEVKGPRPPCMNQVGPDDFCVFDDGHSGPCWGADDVATPVDLPPRPTEPEETP